MNAFDILAEVKMRQWERERKEAPDKPRPAHQFVFDGSSESFEKQLFDNIKQLILRSRQEDPQTRAQTLKQAERIHVQLSARLERSGCRYLSQYVFDVIGRLKGGLDEDESPL